MNSLDMWKAEDPFTSVVNNINLHPWGSVTAQIQIYVRLLFSDVSVTIMEHHLNCSTAQLLLNCSLDLVMPCFGILGMSSIVS